MAVGGVTFSSDDIVVKSPNDRRLYRYIQLHNELCALLVHDPEISKDLLEPSVDTEDDDDEEDDDVDMEDEDDDDVDMEDDDDEDEDEEEMSGGDGKSKKKGGSAQTKQAAAAMCVGMGSFSDPFEAQGLAHFLEHMLFMGSAEFPDENEYDSYLSKHGGSSNAYTEAEHTCYHFEVKREFLKGALTRFSQFFISPLVKAEAMEREVQAVDSEFNQVLQNDSCRLQQLQCHTAAPGHCFNRFFWGNKKSLVDAMENGIDLREHILKLYAKNYHGGLMKLVVIGGESLDILESWVLELFSNIKKGPPLKQEIRTAVPVWEAGKVYRLEAVRDVHILNLSWTLPCLRKDYLKRSEDYLAHLVGHEGKGSLHFFLKAKGWVTSISAGVGDEGMHRSQIGYIFGMSINLTDCGLEKVFEIIGYVYQYFKLLRRVSPQEWIFKELQDIANMEFRFAEEQAQDDYAAELSENLLIYPPEHIIYGEYAYKLWDEDMIKHLLSFFTPENMRVDVVSKSMNRSEDSLFEPWFGSKYTEENISPSLMELWRNPSQIDEVLHLPVKNEFIPCDFAIRADKSSSSDTFSPKCIFDEPLMMLWYKLDRTFKFPRANTYFRITMKGAYTTLKNNLLTELFVLLLKDELNEVIYQASIAKLETSVSLYSDKLELKIYGFNDKLLILLAKVLETSKTFVPTDDRFKVIKEDMERTLRNTNMKPLSHSSYLRLQILCQSFWDVEEKLKLLNDLTLADLKAFIPGLLSQVEIKKLSLSSLKLLAFSGEKPDNIVEPNMGLKAAAKKLYIEGLCHGNILEEEAIKISDIFKSNFPVQPIPNEMRHKEYVVHLDSGADLIRDVRVKNKSETNSVVELYYQIEPEVMPEAIKLKALADLFYEIVDEPLFNQLRTKEQLGYVVDCSSRVTYRIVGLCFRVQSSKYNPVYLQGRIDTFINGLGNMFDALDKESFESFKSGVIAKLLEKEPCLQYETNRHWNQIIDKRYMFDFSEKEAEEVKKIQKSDIIEWYNTYLRKTSPKCRRLAIRVWGCNAGWKDTHTEATPVRVIDDVAAFKRLSKFYPSMS